MSSIADVEGCKLRATLKNLGFRPNTSQQGTKKGASQPSSQPALECRFFIQGARLLLNTPRAQLPCFILLTNSRLLLGSSSDKARMFPPCSFAVVYFSSDKCFSVAALSSQFCPSKGSTLCLSWISVQLSRQRLLMSYPSGFDRGM